MIQNDEIGFHFLIHLTQIIKVQVETGKVGASQNMEEFFENWKSALEKLCYAYIQILKEFHKTNS